MGTITEASLRATHPVLGEILDGRFDGKLLEDLQHAIAMRKKQMFRKGTKVKLVGTTNVTIDGKIATVLKVNSTRISVGIGDPKTEFGHTYYPDGEFNVPPRMLELV